MHRSLLVTAAAALAFGTLVSAAPQARPAPARPPAAAVSPGLPAEAQNALVARYCVTCHSERGEGRRAVARRFRRRARSTEHGELAEKMIRKLRARHDAAVRRAAARTTRR